MNKMLNKAAILNKFEKSNKELKEKNLHTEIFLFGSGLGIYWMDTDYRKTTDVDYRTLFDEFDKDVSHILSSNSINFMGGINLVPPTEEMEIGDEIILSNITIKIPRLEYLVISKLFSDRPKDLNDLEKYPILDNCDLNFVQELLEEYLPYYVFNENPSHNFNFYEDVLKARHLCVPLYKKLKEIHEKNHSMEQKDKKERSKNDEERF